MYTPLFLRYFIYYVLLWFINSLMFFFPFSLQQWVFAHCIFIHLSAKFLAYPDVCNIVPALKEHIAWLKVDSGTWNN